MKGVKVLFAHDTEVGLQAAAALVNSDQGEVDELAGLDDLDAFLDRWGWTGRRRRTRTELAEVHALRDRLRPLWELETDDLVEEVNALLREASALPQLVRHDGWDYHLHATPPDAPLADRMAVEAAMALVDVIRSGETSRLRVCAADDCRDVVVDLSKNRSRRFCERGCGNRVAVAAYRARRNAG